MIRRDAHYWLAGNKPGQVFSSARPGWVAETDADYLAWLAARTLDDSGTNLPSRILSDGELADVLLKAGLPNTTVAACGARDWGHVTPEDALAVVQAIGVAVTSTGTPALSATYEISGQVWADMINEAQYVTSLGSGTEFSDGESSLEWSVRGGAVAFDTAAHFLAVVKGLAQYLTGWKKHFALGADAPTLGHITIA